MLLLGLWPLALLGRELLAHWQWRRGVIGLAVAAGLAAGGADVALMATGALGGGDAALGGMGYVAPAVSPIWFMAIVLVLIRDFADSISRQQLQNRRMAERLQLQQRELQRLHHGEQLRARERAAEEERQRIMQDMHDGLGSQLLSSLALVERGDLDGERTGALLRDCIDDLRLAIDSLAGGDDGFAVMAGNLRFRMTPRLRAAGITLRWHARDFDDALPVPPKRSLPLLRILQESMSNALRHAGAREIAVTLASDAEGVLSLEVRDDGRGFDPAQVRRGKGLAGIEKRVRAIHGRLALESGPQGTSLRVQMPPPVVGPLPPATIPVVSEGGSAGSSRG
jgi:signal transduction histidine kinase